jgi:hypothetical protein
LGDAPEGHNAARGTVAESGYLGGLSVFHVRIRDSVTLRVQVANRERAPVALAPGSAVALHWPAEAGVLLRE